MAVQASKMASIVLATASYDHTIKLFDPHSGKSWVTIKCPDTQVNAMCLRCALRAALHFP